MQTASPICLLRSVGGGRCSRQKLLRTIWVSSQDCTTIVVVSALCNGSGRDKGSISFFLFADNRTLLRYEEYQSASFPKLLMETSLSYTLEASSIVRNRSTFMKTRGEMKMRVFCISMEEGPLPSSPNGRGSPSSASVPPSLYPVYITGPTTTNHQTSLRMSALAVTPPPSTARWIPPPPPPPLPPAAAAEAR